MNPPPDLSTIYCWSEEYPDFPNNETVQNFAAHSKWCKENADAWPQTLRAKCPDIDFQRLERTIHFYAEKSCFWEEQIPKVENLLRQEGAKELVAVFQYAPAFYLWDLLHNYPDRLLDYLWALKRVVDEGKCKLSKLQIEILLDLYAFSLWGSGPALWIPSKVLESHSPADLTAMSRAIKRLEERGLIVRQPKKGENTPRRTRQVIFTYLGLIVTEPIWHSLDKDVRRYKMRWITGKASWQKKVVKHSRCSRDNAHSC